MEHDEVVLNQVKKISYFEGSFIDINNYIDIPALNRLPCIDEDSYKGYVSINGDLVVHVDEVVGGGVFQSLPDYISYMLFHGDFDLPFAVRGFVSDKGEIIEYVQSLEAGGERKIYNSNLSSACGSLPYLINSDNTICIFKNLYDLNQFEASQGNSVIQKLRTNQKSAITDFRSFATEIISTLLAIPSASLDLSPKSFSLMDETLSNLFFEDTLFFHLLFPLTYYFREALLAGKNNTKWQRCTKDYGIEMLCLCNNDGSTLCPHQYIYENLKSEYYHMPQLWFLYEEIAGRMTSK